MKNLKKVVALVIAMTVIFTLGAFAKFEDVADDNANAEAISILTSLNIIKGYEEEGKTLFKPDATITRAETAAIVCRMLGLEGAAEGAKGMTVFKDVPADNWASGYVNLASARKIIAGYGDGNFGPNDPVKYEQVVKMIVATLGYSPKADVMGGYPSGYLVIASQEQITKGAIAQNGEDAKRTVVARLVFNALDVRLMEQTDFSASEPGYSAVDKTLLWDYLGVRKIEGIVSTSYFESGNKDEKKTVTFESYSYNYWQYNQKVKQTVNNQTVGGQLKFLIGNTNAANYVGFLVTAFIADYDESNATILAIAPKSGYNARLVINSSNLENVNTSGANTIVEYWPNDRQTDKKTTTVKLDDTNMVVYRNGVQISANLASDLYMIQGELVLLDNNDDGYYEHAFVTDYSQTYIVDSVEKENYTVITKNGETLDFDPDNTAIVMIIKDGKEITFDQLQKNDVLSVVADDPDLTSAGLIKYYVSTASVSGDITETYTQTEQVNGVATSVAYVVINNKAYKVAQNIIGSAPQNGDNGTFYLTIDGAIATKDASTVLGKYVYIYDVGSTTSFSTPTVTVKAITVDGDKVQKVLSDTVRVYYPVASNTAVSEVCATKLKDIKTANIGDGALKFNGMIYTTDNAGETKFMMGNAALVRYDEDSSGKITKILFPTDEGVSGSDFEKLSLSSNFTFDADDPDVDGNVVNNDTKVFSIKTTNGLVGGPTDEDNSMVTTYSSVFQDTKSYSNSNVFAYDLKDGKVSVVVAINQVTDVPKAAKAYVVKSFAKSYVNSEERTKFSLVGGKESIDVLVASDTTSMYDNALATDVAISDIKAGDVIVFGLNGKNEIQSVARLVSIDNVKAIQVSAAAGNTVTIANMPVSTNDKGNTDKLNYFGWISNKDNNNTRVTLSELNGVVTGAKTLTCKTDIPYTAVENIFTTMKFSSYSFGQILANVYSAGTNNNKPTYFALIRTDENKVTDVVVYAVPFQ